MDVGGTFTDVVSVDERGAVRIGKTLTTPGAEHEGVANAIANAGVDLASVDILVHGTTLVINALTERRSCRVALLTTRGFRDIHLMGRSNRPQDTNIFYRRDEPLVPRHLIFEVDERLAADGTVIAAPDLVGVKEIAGELRSARVDAVAVAFLNSYAGSANEDMVAAAVASDLPDVFVCTSSSISRGWREYERFTTAAANAFVGPAVHRYLGAIGDRLGAQGFGGAFVVLDSNGGALSLGTASRLPVRLVESGPVGGAVASRELTSSLEIDSAVSFDMGGTTAKSALIEDGEFGSADMYWPVGYDTGFPVQISCVDIVEVGAGGGSIAWVDDGGRLRVGPRSAGASPGPACYGLGGADVTVTDANVVCGRLPADYFIAPFALRPELSAEAVSRLAGQLAMEPLRLAAGVIEMANHVMAEVVRQQTVVRGRDPRRLTLIGFGGAGPMHACEVAALADVPRVLIPASPGHFSAFGMLQADLRYDLKEMLHGLILEQDLAQLAAKIERMAGQLARAVSDGLEAGAGDARELAGDSASREDVQFGVVFSLRYFGQAHTLRIPVSHPGLALTADDLAGLAASFVAEHRRRFGHVHASAPVEVVDVEVNVRRPLPRSALTSADASGYDRGEAMAEVHFAGNGLVQTRIVSRGALPEGSEFSGPLVTYEPGSVVVVPPGARGRVLAGGVLDIDVEDVHPSGQGR